MFCRYLLNLFDSLCLFFNDLSIGEREALKSPTIIVWDSMCVLNFNKASFMNVGVLTFGTQTIRIESFP